MKTLFLLKNPHKIDEIIRMSTAQDTVVLLGDGVLANTRHLTHRFYILEVETELLPTHTYHILSYLEFTNLILQHTRCITV